MNQSERDLWRAIEELNGRLRALERRFGGAAADARTPDVVEEERAARVKSDRREATLQPSASAPPVVQNVATPPVATVGASAAAGSSVAPPTSRVGEQPVAKVGGVVVAPPVVRAAPLSAEKTAERSWSLEKWYGGRLAAVLGALFAVVGFAMFLKLGVERGWFTLSPTLRCVFAAAFGVALIGVGEVARRKLGKAAVIVHAAIAGTGLAIVYGSAYAAFGLWGLISAPVAFVFLAVVCVGGIGLALWSASLPLAVVSLVGAFLNPILMRDGGGPAVVVPAYLVSIMVLGLTLAGWRPAPFRLARAITWWGVVVVGSMWLLSESAAHPLLALGFLGVVWSLIHGAIALEWRATGTASESARDDDGRDAAIGWKVAEPLMLSVSCTLWCVGVGVLVVQAVSIGVRDWMIPAAGVVGTSVLAVMLAGHLRVLRDRPRTDAERLGAVLWVQASGLLITTMALGLSGWMQVVGWLAMGLAAIAGGRWTRAKALEVFGLLLLIIAMGRLIVWDSWNTPTPAGGVMRALGLHIGRWSILMFMAGAAWLGASGLIHQVNDAARVRRVVVDLALAIGVLVMWMGLVNFDHDPASLLIAGAMAAMVITIVSRVRASAVLLVIGSAFLLGLTLVGGVGNLVTSGSQQVRIAGIVLTQYAGVMLAAAIAWGVVAWRCWTGMPRWVPGATIAVGAAAVALMVMVVGKGSSMVFVPLVWVGIAGGVMGVYARRRLVALDVVGLGVLWCAVLAWGAENFVRVGWSDSAARPLMHPGLWVAVVMAIAMSAVGAWLVGWRGGVARATLKELAQGTVAGSVALLLIATSFEVSRSAGVWLPRDETAQGAVVSIWWGVFASCLLAVGFGARMTMVRRAGLILLFAAAIKTVVFDLAQTAQEWRIVSMIGLGLTMLGVALVYARVSARVDRAAADAGAKSGDSPPGV